MKSSSRDSQGKFKKGHKVFLGRVHSSETKRKMSERAKLDGRGIINVGRKWTKEQRLRFSEMRRGSNSPLWKGGLTKVNDLIRKSSAYRMWREAVFKRDDYVCQGCGKRGLEIQADHIKPFAFFPELRFSIENGRTLCIPCHKQTPTYGRPVLANKNIRG